jgi:hypothetical protein
MVDNVNTHIVNAEDVTNPEIDPVDDPNDGEHQLAGVADNEEDGVLRNDETCSASDDV